MKKSVERQKSLWNSQEPVNIPSKACHRHGCGKNVEILCAGAGKNERCASVGPAQRPAKQPKPAV
jgi:hypothetical protein